VTSSTDERELEVAVHRSARVLGVDDKPALELVNVNGEVKVALLPQNGSKRQPVRLDDLTKAIEGLSA